MKHYFTDTVSPLLKLAFPLILTGLVQSSVYFFETLFLSRLGEDVMAAGAIVGWVFGTFMVVIFGTLSAVSVLVSHKHGAEDQEGISHVMRDGMVLSFLLLVPSMLLLWNLPAILVSTGQRPEVVVLAQSYLRVLIWGAPPQFLMMVFMELIMGIGRSKEIAFFSMLMPIFSVVFSYIFIFGHLGLPPLGIVGAGWGLAAASWLTAALVTFHVLTAGAYKKYFSKGFVFHPPFHLAELARTGLPMGLMYGIEVGFFLVLTLTMGVLGTDFLAANQIVMQFAGLQFQVIFSLAQAVTIRMGHLIGANHPMAARATSRAGLGLSILFMSAVALVYWGAPERLVALDFDPTLPANVAIVRLACGLFAVCGVFQILEGARISLFGSLRALKDTRFTLLVSIISFWGIALPLGYLLAWHLHWQGKGLWWGMVTGAFVAMIVLYCRLQSRMDPRWRPTPPLG